MKTSRGIRWKVISEFPLYEISEEGQVRSYRRKSRTWRNPRSGVRDTPIILTGTVTPLGYTAFILRDANGRPHRRMAHRLAAQAFLPNPSGLPDVAHNDGNPAHNEVNNLRWATHRDNQMDMRRHGTMQDGERCCMAKLTTEQVEQIRAAREIFGRGVQRKLAAFFKVSTAQVSKIVNGHRWASTFGECNG